MNYYYLGIVCLMAVEAVLFWKLGYSRGMIAAMQEQTKAEQMRMWNNLFKGGDDDEEE